MLTRRRKGRAAMHTMRRPAIAVDAAVGKRERKRRSARLPDRRRCERLALVRRECRDRLGRLIIGNDTGPPYRWEVVRLSASGHRLTSGLVIVEFLRMRSWRTRPWRIGLAMGLANEALTNEIECRLEILHEIPPIFDADRYADESIRNPRAGQFQFRHFRMGRGGRMTGK